MATLSEHDLLERLRQRDEATFNRVVCLYTNAILEHVRARVVDPGVAECLVQEVFVRAFRDAERAPAASGLFLWLCALADDQIKAML